MNQHTENKKTYPYILQTLQYTNQIITNQYGQDPIPWALITISQQLLFVEEQLSERELPC